MKLKIYSIAAMVMGLMAFTTLGYAQETAAAPQAKTATSAHSAAQSAPQTYSYSAPEAYTPSYPQAYTVSPAYGLSYDNDQPGDSTYKNKMRKLQEQIRALNREASELSREQTKKSSLAMQERMTTMRKTMSVRFDSSFNRNMNRGLGNIRINNNSDANLDKQVQSGEVKEKTKAFTKTYPADGNDKLQIDNRYGKVTVNTWNKNEFKVDVQIKAYADNDDDAQKLLDQTTIEDSKANNLVSFTTVIDKGRSSNTFWGTLTTNGKTIVRKTVINYIIYMPAKSAVSITNKYGAIELPTLEGKVTINSSNSNLTAKSLSNSDLNISYGSLNLGWADNINANLNFTPVKIGKLGTSGTFNIRYGEGLEISDVGKNLKNLTVNSSYVPVKLGSINDINADFDVTVRLSPFLYNNATNVTSKTPETEHGYTSTKNYKGHVGKGSADKVITVKSSYGTVKFD